MDIDRIKAILLAVEKKSFSKAAEELSYTPSALSHIADSIENELGVKILNRNFNGIELTDNGKILYKKFKAIVNAERDLLCCAEKINCNGSLLRIGTYSSISQNLLPQILRKFKQENPTIKVSIKVGNHLRDWLEEDVADVIFTDTPPSNANWVKIMDDPFMAIFPYELFSEKKVVTKDELYQYPCIIHNESVFENYFETQKFKEIINFDSVDESSIFSMVKEKIGISILPQLMLKSKIKHIRAAKLQPEISREIGCAFKRGYSQNECADKFVKFIKKNYQHNKKT